MNFGEIDENSACHPKIAHQGILLPLLYMYWLLMDFRFFYKHQGNRIEPQWCLNLSNFETEVVLRWWLVISGQEKDYQLTNIEFQMIISLLHT